MSQTYATYEGNEPYIFVSYSHKDTELVMPIIRALQEHGFRVWYDEGIEAGTEWPPSISRHLKASHCLISFMSPRAADSRNCQKEILLAQSQEPPIPMLCVYLEDFPLPDGLDMQLCDIQAMFWYRHRNNESFMQKLIKAKILQECRGATTSTPNTDTATKKEALPEETELQKLMRLAESGDMKAQFSLGNAYHYGEGTEKDLEKAVFWWKKAAEQGHVSAQYLLGESYYLGQGVGENDEKAAFWYQKAAEQGNTVAQKALSECYRHGVGVEIDDDLADYWLKLSEEAAPDT